jgi:radical SAM-linked protein
LKVELRFSVRGRARYLSHLESVDMLLAALRRVGCEVALSLGMRPKPVISLALPRAVGVESSDELALVELVHDPIGDEEAWLAALAERLNATLPDGVRVHAAHRAAAGKTRVISVQYHVPVEADPALLEQAAAVYAELDEAPVVRTSPKGSKTVDVRRSVAAVRPSAGGVEFDIAVSDDGFARPEEVVRALADAIDAPLRAGAPIRVQIVTAATPTGAAVPVESTL